MSVLVLRGDARCLPLPDACVDLVVTSPPYFGLRSYTDGGEHYDGQVGSEATPGEYVAALVACTREWVRCLKPCGSLFVNLGDKYSQRTQTRRSSHQPGIFPGKFPEFSETWAERAAKGATRMPHQNIVGDDGSSYVAEKSLMGLPWRYALAATDQLGLILRAEIIWAKPNGLPESVTDRVRRAHEQVFHFTLRPRYYSAVDEIREPHTGNAHGSGNGTSRRWLTSNAGGNHRALDTDPAEYNPLGKLPGSVWDIPSQPLTVPPHLGVDHFAAFPMELPRRIIAGWSPPGVCTACGEGRRPVAEADYRVTTADISPASKRLNPAQGNNFAIRTWDRALRQTTITGYACACPRPDAPARPATILDPFGGTGTTALLAHALGRTGITIDRSADYCRLAAWRTTDPAELARALEVPKPPVQADGQDALFEVAP